MLCAEHGAVDRYTNSASLFGIFDKIIVSTVPADAPLPPQMNNPRMVLTIQVLALWAREPGDEEGEFEYQITIQPPGEPEADLVKEGPFSFGASNHRFWVKVLAEPPAKESGVLRLASRVRRPKGVWMEQSFDIALEVKPPESKG